MNDGLTTANGAAELFAGPGEVRALARTLDWGATPLGWPDTWSPALRIATRAMLDSPFPICLWSGPHFTLVYNDAYRRILAVKHPAALGQPGSLVWAEIWEGLEPQVAQVRAGGPPVYFENARFVMARLEGGRTEDAWFSYSLSALRDEDGSVAAVLNISPETTGQVLVENALERARDRADRLQTLTAALAATSTPAEVAEVVVAQGVSAAGAATGMLSLRASHVGEDGAAEMVILRQTGLTPGVSSAYARFPVDAPVPTATSVRTGQAFFLEEREALHAAFPEIPDVWESLGTHALATVPLSVGGERVGAMSFTFTAPRLFPSEDREFFLALGRQAAQALERARLSEAEHIARVRAESLQRVTAALAGAQTMADVGRVFSRELTTLIGADTAWVGAVTPDGTAVEALGWSGYEEGAADRWRRLPIDAGIALTDVVRSARPQWWPTREALAAAYPERASLIRSLRQDGVTFLPILADGEQVPGEGGDGDATVRAVGGIVVGFYSPQRFDADTRAFFLALAQQCAQAIARARAYEAEQAARREAEAARQAAEEANRAKSQFLATMSHELRTPLNAIGGYAELMEIGVRGPVTPEQRADLERIRRAQRHLLGLINGVLNYVRIDAGALDYEITDVPLDEVLATCGALIEPQALAKSLVLHHEPRDRTLLVRADREKVQQVVLNLLSNAVKFTESGGRVSLGCEARPDATVAIWVSDTGRGIAADQLEHVFQPFVQLDASLTRTQEGTGLGLAISRDLARGMGGDLTAESTPGVGSTFTLVLPGVLVRGNETGG
ncbi:MAG TPA: ATP-binding protein [Longimicrobiaceae bacterium]|nr:ATP-binding protein [Longimicrobiaceae bacterium]